MAIADSSDGAELPKLEEGDGACQESISMPARLMCSEARHIQTMFEVIAVNKNQRSSPFTELRSMAVAMAEHVFRRVCF